MEFDLTWGNGLIPYEMMWILFVMIMGCWLEGDFENQNRIVFLAFGVKIATRWIGFEC